MGTNVTVGRISATWTPAEGLRIDIDQVPVVRRSTFYIVKAGWTGLLFGQNSARWSSADWKTSGKQAILETEAANPDARVTHRLVASDDRIDVETSWELLRDVAAEIEHATAYINAPLLAGPWKTDSSSGILSPAPPAVGRTQQENRLAAGFGKLDFNTPLGPLALRWEGNAPPPVVFDARSDSQEWAKTWPVLWMGIGSPARPLAKQDGRVTLRWSLAVGPAPSRLPDVPLGILTPGWKSSPAALLPPRPILIPRPKQQQPRPGAFRITPDCVVVRPESGREAARRLVEGIRNRFGIVLATSSVAPRSKAVIRLEDPTLRAPGKPEGYAISISSESVRVSGNDAAGMRWGVETLLQWMTSDNRSPLWEATEISDWPTLAFRGIHLFHGREALPFHQKLIERVLAPGKFNHLVLQCEQVRWNHDPATAPSWAGTPTQVAAEIAFAKRHGIRMVPLVQGYGHMEWLFARDSNRKYAEDPETPYAVHFDNPDAVRYLEGFVDEANMLFQAGAFHVGLDEVTMRGRFPFRSEGKTFPELFTRAVKHWHRHLAARNTETWLWADMLLHPSEVAPCFGTAPSPRDAKAVRDGLPSDLVLFDWQYDARSRYPCLDLLRREGFERRVATTWFQTDGIRAFAQAAAQSGAWGALQSTWCGYESKEAVLSTIERRQFTAMVAAAEHFWNGGSTTLPIDPGERFQRQWAGPDPRRERAAPGYVGAPAPQAAEPHLAIANAKRPSRQRTADGTDTLLGGPIALADRCGPGGLPRAVRIPLPPGTVELRLLVAATRRASEATPVGAVEWSGRGLSGRKELRYGQQLAATDDTVTCSEAPVVDERKSVLGTPLRLRMVTIELPGATEATISATHPSAAPVVYGWTVATKSTQPGKKSTQPQRRTR